MTTTAEPTRTRFRLQLAERPLRSKLDLLLLSVSAALPARRAEQAGRLVNVGGPAGELATQLQRECAAAVVLAQSSRPRAIGACRNQAEEFAPASRHGHTVEETFMRARGRS